MLNSKILFFEEKISTNMTKIVWFGYDTVICLIEDNAPIALMLQRLLQQ